MTTNATATLRQPAALIGRRRAHPAYERVGKPVLDRTVGLVLLVLAVPLLAVLALVVLLALGRPVLHRQVRVGRHGEHFTLLKLRTMRPDRRAAGDQRSPAVDRRVAHKDDEDPRHTPVGRFLRRWSLDEIPNLWNVLSGDLSLSDLARCWPRRSPSSPPNSATTSRCAAAPSRRASPVLPRSRAETTSLCANGRSSTCGTSSSARGRSICGS